MSPMGIAQVLRALPQGRVHPDLLVGTETSDDAGVFRLADGLALVQTVDFFPPLVDDPATFGRIAAANALSDVYAMNGRPITALNIVGFPDDQLPMEILAEIVRGAGEVVSSAGAVTLGGHSVRDAEIKFGLSVTGLIDPAELLTNASTREGDFLVLTKPLGTGYAMTANKKGELRAEAYEAAVRSMTQLNAVGRDAARACGGDVHAMTDVTGYGLAGHASEMAEGSGLEIVLETAAFPRLPDCESVVVDRYRTRANKTNRSFLEGRLAVGSSTDPIGLELAFDPQTSGGLLIAVAPASVDRLLGELTRLGALAASVVGRARRRSGGIAIRLI
ncbi:MAG: selenide, water dikinase SelD [Isosphaeraceae bacterium]|nr:selenide, water dikinase SelD [Isosphaeraceae bacterium]